MRILHISTRLILGGSQENTILSCEGQARLGHEVHLAFGPIYGPEGSLLERVERFNRGESVAGGGVQVRDARHPIRTHTIPNLVREINPLADTQALRELEALIRDLKPDIVHTHSSKAGILGRLAAWKVAEERHSELGIRHSGSDASRMPNRECLLPNSTDAESRMPDAAPASPPLGIIHTIHGPPFMPGAGLLLKRAAIAAKNHAYVLAERRAAHRCHLIVSVANAMTTLFLAKGIGKPEQYVTVYSGMEVEPYLTTAPPAGESRDEMRDQLKLASTDFVIGTVARLAEHKGHDDLLDALADDLKKNPSWKLLWVGDGWWRDRLTQRIQALGLQPQVIMTGLVAPERIPGLVRAMDVLAHPSYREGLPRTVPQALLSGVPVIAYDCDGTSEACIEGETGKLVRVGDRAGLRTGVQWLYDHPGERLAMGARGRELCRTRFSAATMVSELEKVYVRALEMAGGIPGNVDHSRDAARAARPDA